MGHKENIPSMAELSVSIPISEMLGHFCQFLDDFEGAQDKAALIADEPHWSSNPGRWPYDFAACAHKLANDNALEVPEWTLKEEYISPVPQCAFGTEDPEFRKYLEMTTPAEYAQRNLFLGENVAKRA